MTRQFFTRLEEEEGAVEIDPKELDEELDELEKDEEEKNDEDEDEAI